jgi:hypothetical protein
MGSSKTGFQMLTSNFNVNAKKSEVRRRSNGSTETWMGNTLVSRFWHDGSRDKYGAEMKNQRLKDEAAREKQLRKDEAVRAIEARKQNQNRRGPGLRFPS